MTDTDMTESSDEQPTTEPAAADDRKIHAVVPMHQVPDANLIAMLIIADSVGFPLTLYMPWGIASGNIAAPNEFYKYLGDSIRSGSLPADVPPGWQDVIERFAEVNCDPYAELEVGARHRDSVVDGFDITSQFTLKDAVCWIGGFPQPTRHDYLRVKLADITAWAWGKADT